MSQFEIHNMNGNNIGSQQFGDYNLTYIERPVVAHLSPEDWNKLKGELEVLTKKQEENDIVGMTNELLKKENRKGLRKMFSEHMPEFVRDVMSNLTAEGLLALCKLLIEI